MNQNIFEQFQAEKQKLIQTAQIAKENGWITEDREKEIVDKINNDILTLGVIGQMKCGKSTFLNAFVFGDTVLPSATTPMTAALSVITYGKDKKLVAEFYSPDEWAEQKLQADRSLDEVAGNAMEESKVKAAKELVAKSANLPGNVNSFLGKSQEDTFENLEEYVGADGKFVSITKSVTIYYPHDYLKGVEIVDTPGFNDPIVSREERTKDFLKKADVILLMLYASRAFDSTDRSILFKNVRQCGIGKILIGVNKYDIAYGNGETEAEIIANVKEQIGRACTDTGDETMAALVKENDPILLSAEMSLLSQLPMSKIQNRENLLHSWKNACDNFEISSQMEMAVKSRINHLIDAVKRIIERDKIEVLLRKPANAIKAAANSKKEELEHQLRETCSLIDNLQQPDEELEERKDKLGRAKKRIQKKIDSLGDDIEISFNNIIRKGRNEMEDEVDSACNRMVRIVDNMKRTQGPDDIIPALESEQNKLIQRTLKRCFERICEDAKRTTTSCVRSFCEETADVLERYIEDFDARDFVKSIEKRVSFDVDNNNMFSVTSEDSSSDDEVSFLDVITGLIKAPFEAYFGAFSKGYDFLTNNRDNKKELKSIIENIRANFDVNDFLNSLIDRKDEVISSLKTLILDDLLTPMQNQLDEILNSVSDKEKALHEAIAKKQEIENGLNLFKAQYSKVYSD
ncbi:hypothetical protein HDR58_10305 [bacterium]|nr:hypothetical protein [bacterium]